MIVETSNSTGGGSVVLAFLVGAVLVVVATIGFFMWDNYKSGGHPGGTPSITVNVKK